MTAPARKTFPKNVRVGIAFEGGGAKGSFGWAVVEKLQEAGIEPVAVSGTSAGALSAVAFAAGKFEEGSELYRSLVLKDIFPFNLHWAVGLPLLALSYVAHAILRLAKGMNATHVEHEMAFANVLPRIVLTVAVMATCFFMLVNYSDPYVSEVRSVQWSVFSFAFPTLYLLCWHIALFGAPNWYLRLIVLSLAGSVIGAFLMAFPWKNFHGNESALEHFRPHSFDLIILLAALVWIIAGKRHTTFNFVRGTLLSLLGIAVFKALFSLPWEIIHSSEYPSMEMAAPYLIAFIPFFIFAAIYSLALPLSKITLASNNALRARVEHLARDGVSIDCFVALASVRKVFDPDSPTVRTENITNTPGAGIHYPVHVPVYIPFYFNLMKMKADAIGQLAVASAALPFGIVPASTYEGCEYVDGGMADNCPIRPLVDEAECDLLITIHLRPRAILGELDKHYQATWRLSTLLEHRSHWSEYNQYDPDTSWWEKIVHIKDKEMPVHLPVMPDMDLGWLLDFRKASISRRIAEGHKQGQILVDMLLDALGEPEIGGADSLVEAQAGSSSDHAS
jgi:predicted acylesterase/phospholipase RssA